jgi:hypothetical protein
MRRGRRIPEGQEWCVTAEGKPRSGFPLAGCYEVLRDRWQCICAMPSKLAVDWRGNLQPDVAMARRIAGQVR